MRAINLDAFKRGFQDSSGISCVEAVARRPSGGFFRRWVLLLRGRRQDPYCLPQQSHVCSIRTCRIQWTQGKGQGEGRPGLPWHTPLPLASGSLDAAPYLLCGRSGHPLLIFSGVPEERLSQFPTCRPNSPPTQQPLTDVFPSSVPQRTLQEFSTSRCSMLDSHAILEFRKGLLKCS